MRDIDDVFECYLKSRGMSAMKRDGRYVESATRFAFEIWNASRSALRERAEPVAWRDPKTGSLCTPRNKEYGLKGNYASDYAQYSEPLYNAPPAPVVPAETFDEWSRRCEIQLTLCRQEFREVAEITWNACCAAMLNHK